MKKELKPIKELSSDKEDQVAKDHKYQSIHKKEKYPKGKSIFRKVIILVFYSNINKKAIIKSTSENKIKIKTVMSKQLKIKSSQ